jgi:hypothetical protein
MVDRFSSFPFLSKLTTKGTDTITRILTDWFNLYGWPKVIGSNGGPQFRDEFNHWCHTKGIKSIPSSAYNPASNGLAESGVKRAKHLLEKSDSWASFQASFSAYKNVPMARGEAPSTTFFGRVLRQPGLPTVEPQLANQPRDSDAPGDQPSKANGFTIGSMVCIYNPTHKRFDSKGEIVAVCRHKRSFLVKKANGHEVLRNRCLIRPIKTPVSKNI